MSDLNNGSFIVFSGFVNGSRVNEVAKFNVVNAHTIEATQLQANDPAPGFPKPRASASSAVYNDCLYIFGGQDDDNNKLDDLWEYNSNTSTWRQIQISEGDLRPLCRSGHSAVTYGNKMYIFGGILELTKELNDMLVFDFSLNKFVQGEQMPDYRDGSPDRRQGTMQQEAYGEGASPTRTQKGGSPLRRKTTTTGSPMRSPMKSRRVGSPNKT